jgi:hypothetical protein
MRLRLRQPIPAFRSVRANRRWARKQMPVFSMRPPRSQHRVRQRTRPRYCGSATPLTMMTSGEVLGKPAMQLHAQQPVSE